MNATYKELWEEIIKHDKLTLATHVNVDGDSIGSAVALKHLIKLNSNVSEVKISGQKAPRYLDVIDETEEVSDEYFYSSQVVVVDTSTRARITDKRVVPAESIKIDHHHHEETWKIEIGGDHWPATGQLIYEMINALNLKYDDKVRAGVFIAIWTDTEGLTQRNISETTHAAIEWVGELKTPLLKSMELNKAERDHIASLEERMQVEGDVAYLIVDELVSNDYLRQATAILSNKKGFEVYFGVTKSEGDSYRGELRSKGKVNVSTFAKQFGGGGHFASAGFRASSIEQANDFLKVVLKEVNNI